MAFKHFLIDNLKNIYGWETKRKLVAFAVDDYGNVRIDSKKALENINNKNPIKERRFDYFDTLENRQDLEMLYEALSSVKDSLGNPAVFTPYALSANIDFERMKEEGYQTYQYELLPTTYLKLSNLQPEAYQGAWKLWQEGIEKGLMCPEFHGREHFNLNVFEEKLAKKDKALLLSLENRSLVNIGSAKYPTMKWTAAFSFWDPIADTRRFPEIIQLGLSAFEQVYGYKAWAFTPPAQDFPPHYENEINNWGLKAIDTPFYQYKHIGFGKYKRQFSYTSDKKDKNIVKIVRNVVFEPTHSNIDHVSKALNQIEIAFFWNRPVIISSHRVNFCGHIEPKNREKGISSLRLLLKGIIKKWPETEFISIRKLIKIIF